MYRRSITPVIKSALADSPVVFLNGARQTGKSTLAQELVAAGVLDRYLTLDDLTVLAAACADPEEFVASLGQERIVIDEVQRAPELFLGIKASVDRVRTPGRFLLTGSANALVLPRLSDALVGRMEIHTLGPLTQGEIAGTRERFIDALFADGDDFPAAPIDNRAELLRRVAVGGYPEAHARRSTERRSAWFRAYLTTLLQRDVRDLANIEGVTELPRLLALAAARSGGLLSFSGLSRDASMPQSTLKRYVGLLRAVFLLETIPAWSRNVGKRLMKSPKLYINDSGVASHLLGLAGSIPESHGSCGKLFETFVAMEIARQRAWSNNPVEMFHFRTYGGDEVDVVLEDPAGSVVGIEIKLARAVGSKDFRGLKGLKALAGDSFQKGVLLYTGDQVLPFGDKLWCLPVSALWGR